MGCRSETIYLTFFDLNLCRPFLQTQTEPVKQQHMCLALVGVLLACSGGCFGASLIWQVTV